MNWRCFNNIILLIINKQTALFTNDLVQLLTQNLQNIQTQNYYYYQIGYILLRIFSCVYNICMFVKLVIRSFRIFPCCVFLCFMYMNANSKLDQLRIRFISCLCIFISCTFHVGFHVIFYKNKLKLLNIKF